MPTTQIAVSLRGMRFHTLIGILPHERELPQPLEVDLTAWISSKTPLDYRLLYDLTAAIAGRGAGYLEEMADQLASDVLALGGVSRVAIVIRKPHVSLPGPLECAEIRLERDAVVPDSQS